MAINMALRWSLGDLVASVAINMPLRWSWGRGGSLAINMPLRWSLGDEV